MRTDARETIEQLPENDTWLFAHMVIAFWHTFGISNGLTIKKEDIEEIRYREGPRGYQIKSSVMQEKLAEYIQWLERYKEKWGTGHYSCPEYMREGIYTARSEGQADQERVTITKMIELLQV